MNICRMIEDVIFVPDKGNDIFFFNDEMNAKIMFFESAEGKCRKVRFGKIYAPADLKDLSEPVSLYSAETIKKLLVEGIISNEYDVNHPVCNTWLMSELLQNEKTSSKEVLSVILEESKDLYTQDILTSFVSIARNPEALDWLFENGAELKTVVGFGNPVISQLISAEVTNDNRNIDYLLQKLNCDTVDVLKELAAK